MGERSWRQEGACREMDPGPFFADQNEEPKRVAYAKSVCAGCPVRQECLAFGLKERFGVWGGMTPQERRRLVKTSPAYRGLARSV